MKIYENHRKIVDYRMTADINISLPYLEGEIIDRFEILPFDFTNSNPEIGVAEMEII